MLCITLWVGTDLVQPYIGFEAWVPAKPAQCQWRIPVEFRHIDLRHPHFMEYIVWNLDNSLTGQIHIFFMQYMPFTYTVSSCILIPECTVMSVVDSSNFNSVPKPLLFVMQMACNASLLLRFVSLLSCHMALALISKLSVRYASWFSINF